MKLKVNKNEIKIIEKSILNDGEYKVNKCEFEFSKEYDGLIKKAVFSSDYKYYKMVVENDECDIPIEVLKKGKIKIGVYAYKIENGEYVRRYSPAPIVVEVIDGSYVEKIENISTPSEVEQLEEQLQNKQDILISGTNIKTLNGENLLGEGNINISASGDMKKEVYDTNNNGIVDNAEKVNNHTVQTDVPANAVFTDTVFSGDYNDLSNKPSIPSKTSDLTNDSGYISDYTETDPTVPSHVKSISQGDIANWNNKSTFSGNYEDLTNKPTIPTVPTNVSAFSNDAGYLTSHQDISGKQDTLVSGTNIKTINNESILGSGNIEIQGGGTTYTAGTNIEITEDNVINNLVDYSINTTGNNQMALGKGATASYSNSCAVGNNAKASSSSLAVGNNASAETYNSLAIGYNSKTYYNGSIALGLSAKTTKANQMVAGSDLYNINEMAIYTSNGLKTMATQEYVDNKAIQTSIMETASSDNLDKIVQYTGATDSNYTNGYFYKCVSDGQDPATYSWEEIEVQASSGGGSSADNYDFYTIEKISLSSIMDKSILNPLSNSYDKVIAGLQKAYDLDKIPRFILSDKLLYSTFINAKTKVNGENGQHEIAFNGVIINTLTNTDSFSTSFNNLNNSNFISLYSFSLYIKYNMTDGVVSGLSSNTGSVYSSLVNLAAINNTKSFTPTGNYHLTNKKYVDDKVATVSQFKPTTIDGYDSTKTQILKNINGTLTWVDE